MSKTMMVQVLVVLKDGTDPEEVYTNMDLTVEHDDIEEYEIVTWGNEEDYK